MNTGLTCRDINADYVSYHPAQFNRAQVFNKVLVISALAGFVLQGFVLYKYSRIFQSNSVLLARLVINAFALTTTLVIPLSLVGGSLVLFEIMRPKDYTPKRLPPPLEDSTKIATPAQIKQLLKVTRDEPFMINILNRMNIEQLQTARGVLGIRTFKRLTEGLNSQPAQFLRTVDKVIACNDRVELQALFKQLEAQKKRPSFAALVALLEKEVRNRGRENLLPQIYTLDPTLRSVTIHFEDNTREPISLSQARISKLRECAVGNMLYAGGDQGNTLEFIREIPDALTFSDACFKSEEEYDSFKRILARLEDKKVTATLDQWLFDLTFAVARFSAEDFQKLMKLFSRSGISSSIEDYCKLLAVLDNLLECKKLPDCKKILDDFKNAAESLYAQVGVEIDPIYANQLALRYNNKELRAAVNNKYRFGTYDKPCLHLERIYKLFDGDEFISRFKVESFIGLATIREIFNTYSGLNDPKALLIREACFDFIDKLKPEEKLKLWGPLNIPTRRKSA